MPTATAAEEASDPPTPTPSAPSTTVVVAGQVFEDRDGDEARDAGEPGVAGVSLALDGRVVGATDEAGRFNLPVSMPPGYGQWLTLVPPDGWQWAGQPLLVKERVDGLLIPLRRVGPPASSGSAPGLLVPGGLVALGTALLAGLIFASLYLTRSYRRYRRLELERIQAETVAWRRAEVAGILEQPNGWRKVLNQLLADALQGYAAVSREGVLKLSAEPASFVVAGEGGAEYLFTTRPEALQGIKLPSRREQVIPLDASLHLTARLEAQTVWEHLMVDWQGDETASLPRQAAWFLIVHRREGQNSALFERGGIKTPPSPPSKLPLTWGDSLPL